MHLSNETFLERLSELFESRKDAGSVFLTTKRLTYEAPDTEDESEQDVKMQDEPEPEPSASTSTDTPVSPSEKEFPLIVRATDGKSKKDTKTKLSTIVQPSDYPSFIDQYTQILRSSLSATLRPKRKRTAANASSGGGTSKKSKSKSTASSKSQATTTTGGAEGTTSSAGFSPTLPKVVGPRRGNGRKKRQAAQARREKIVNKIKKSREERARRAEQTV
ncbi:hypothetical protein JCM16303_001797 [Sporobolomyces ruberrimus]